MNFNHPEDIGHFRAILLKWWEVHKRSYPWREEEFRTPYASVIAELMLRRTRADQVVPVFRRFMEAYPDLASAANTPAEILSEMLYPLGLAWRTDSILAFLKEAYRTFGQDLPSDRATLMSLPGVGDYVGAAVQCFAGDGQSVLIDVNVVRVLGRIFGVDTSGEARRRKDMRELATLAVEKNRPDAYHYALLDFGAKVCRARNPDCLRCPFHEGPECNYYASIKLAAESNS